MPAVVSLFTDVWREQELLRQYATQDRRYERARQAVTPELADRMVALSRLRPNALPGVVSSFAVAGASDEQFRRVVDSAQDDSGMSWFERSIAAAATAVAWPFRGAFEQVIKPAVRGAFLVADTAAEELVQRPVTALMTDLTDSGRNFGEAYRDYGNSEGVIAARRVLSGDNPFTPDDPGTDADESFLGTGFFPGGQVAQESFDQRTLTVQGQRANLFRSLPTTQAWGAAGEQLAGVEGDGPVAATARSIGEFIAPGETAYNVVTGIGQFAADVALDPTAVVTGGTATGAQLLSRLGASDEVVRAVEGGITGARQAARTYDPDEALKIADELAERAGAIRSPERSTVLVEKAEEFLRTPELVDTIAEADAYSIWQSLRRSRAPGADVDMARELGELTDSGEVAEALLRRIGAGDVMAQGFYRGTGNFVQRRLKVPQRMRDALALSPGGRLHADNLDGTAERLDSWLGQLDVDRETRASIFERVARVETNDDLLDVLEDAVRKPLLDEGLGDDELRELTRLVDELRGESSVAGRLYGTDNAARPTRSTWSRTRELRDGDVEVVPTPELVSELADDGFVLPDVRVLRRALERRTKMQKVWRSRGWEWTSDAGRWFTRDVFKPAAILRPAYIIRIGLEEQARLAAAGLDNALTSPLSYIAANLRNRADLKDLTGNSLLEQAQRAHIITSDATGILDDMGRSRRTGTQVWTGLSKAEAGADEYADAWLRELRQLSADPAVRQYVTSGQNADEVVQWARGTDEGTRWVERMSTISDEAADALSSDDGIRTWLRETVAPRLHLKAGGLVDRDTRDVLQLADETLLQAIGDGAVFDDTIDWAGRLKRRLDIAPDFVKVEKAAGAARSKGQTAVDWLFLWITGKPTSYFARFPAYRQLMIRNAEELLPAVADDTLREQVIRSAVDNLNLTRKEAESLARAGRAAEGSSGLVTNLDDFDEAIKTRAAQQVKDLLFDTTRRSNFQEKYEVIFPFFDAWTELVSTWGGLVKENPAYFLRAMQGYQSLEQGGTIYANDFGDKVFAYPGGRLLADFLTPDQGPGGERVGAALEGRVEGANLAAQGVGPGFGPLVQWAVGSMPFFDTQGFREVRNFLTPYGSEIDEAGDWTPAGVADALMPAWADKIFNAVGGGRVDERQWNSTVGDVMKALVATGDYEPGNPDDRRRLLDDARTGARTVLLTRGVLQGVAITGPQATWKVQLDGDAERPTPKWDPQTDPDGHWFTLGAMQAAYYDLLEEAGFDGELATSQFVDQYGVSSWLVPYLTQGKTRSVGEQPVTTEGGYWIDRHAEAAEEYRSTIGFFVPADAATGPMDFAVYRQQLESGDRQSLTDEQQLALANKARGFALYNQARNRLADVPYKLRLSAMSQVRAVLDEELPGWQDNVLGVDEKMDTEGRIRELERAARDPRLDDSPASEAIRLYLDARQRILDIAAGREATTLAAAANADLRAALRAVGRILLNDNEHFTGVWNRLLSREVEEG